MNYKHNKIMGLKSDESYGKNRIKEKFQDVGAGCNRVIREGLQRCPLSKDLKETRESAMVIPGVRVLQAQKPGQKSWSILGTKRPERLKGSHGVEGVGGEVSREVCVGAKCINYIGFMGHCKEFGFYFE